MTKQRGPLQAVTLKFCKKLLDLTDCNGVHVLVAKSSQPTVYSRFVISLSALASFEALYVFERQLAERLTCGFSKYLPSRCSALRRPYNALA